MHVPDGFMNVTMSAATGVISFGTLWAYIRSAKDLIADKFIALTGMMSALIFVLQMINFPVAAGTSGFFQNFARRRKESTLHAHFLPCLAVGGGVDPDIEARSTAGQNERSLPSAVLDLAEK